MLRHSSTCFQADHTYNVMVVLNIVYIKLFPVPVSVARALVSLGSKYIFSSNVMFFLSLKFISCVNSLVLLL